MGSFLVGLVLMGTTGRRREKKSLRLGRKESIQMLRTETSSSVSTDFKQTSSKSSETSQDKLRYFSLSSKFSKLLYLPE